MIFCKAEEDIDDENDEIVKLENMVTIDEDPETGEGPGKQADYILNFEPTDLVIHFIIHTLGMLFMKLFQIFSKKGFFYS